MATTSLPLATAAAFATILSGPANAAPGDQAPVPTTPASPQDNAAPQDQNAPQQNSPQQNNQPGNPPQNTQPGNPQQQGNSQQGNAPQSNPQQGGNCTPTPSAPCTPPAPGQQTAPQQPGVTTPQQPGVTTPQQPGVTTPQQPGTTNPNGPQMAGPQQPGVTNPRVAPLPVPGQPNPGTAPQAMPDQNNPGAQQDLKPGQQPQDQSMVTPTRPQQPQQQGGGNSDNLTGNQGTQQQQQRWNSPSLQQAPAAPVVAMTGPHTEVGANLDGGAVLPGFVANTHHFSNLDGYVGTIGYNTPTGSGDAGAALEFVEPNKIKLTYYTHATDREDSKSEAYIDTTQANAAKAAVEGWIRQQPGGAAALDAAARIGRLPEGEIAPATVNVAGVNTQWGGDVQY
ncbi:hypothetical protein [Nocardia sp. NPDC051570]|uniref:hypothetical protein n=1 Tax=Nocardia sp. NPDC051570 TaxID=3364324 RepID=UPI0037A0CA3D